MLLNFFFYTFPERLLVMWAILQHILLINIVFCCLLNFTFYWLIVPLCWQDRYLNYFIGGATVILVSVSTILGPKSKTRMYCILIFQKIQVTYSVSVHDSLKCKCIVLLFWDRPFYSCGLPTLAFEWMWGWRWHCFDTNLLCFVMEIVHVKILVSIRTTWLT